MTATTGNQPTIPYRRGPAPSSGIVLLDTIQRRVHAFTAVWWYVPLANAGRLLGRAAARVRTWWSWRNTRATLLALDDRMLADIGLDRARLERISLGEIQRHGQGHDALRQLHRMPF